MVNQEKINKYYLKILLIIILLGVGIILYFAFFKNNNEVHILKEYNSSGKLIGTNEYIIKDGDTIIQGKFVNYNENGSKISEGQFVNNEPYGKCVYYYDTGIIESIYFRKDSKISLEAMSNSPDGKLEQYVMYTDFGKPIFIVKYKNGVVESYKGIPQLEVRLHKVDVYSHQYEQINKFYKVGDTLKYNYIVANIPYTKLSFKIENVSIDNTMIKRTLKKFPPNRIEVEEILTKKGKNIIRSIVTYEFSDNVTPVLKDTLTFDINVN